MDVEVPLTSHPNLPDGVPLVANFHDDRNRLSYYHPLVADIDGVRAPLTKFFPVEGGTGSHLDVEYRDITMFMQDRGLPEAFVRGDFSSAKVDPDDGGHIDSRDPYDIETVVLELFRQLGRTKRHLGGRIAVREWVPHDREVRYFIRDGEVLYRDSLDDGDEFPDAAAEQVASVFTTFAWSVDFIRHERNGSWYLIDMGLDGLHHPVSEWVAISEHLDESHSPEQYADEMPAPPQLDPTA